MEFISAFGQLLASIVVAVATVFLWRVTKTLAIETKRMVEAASRPHVVVTIEPNRWSLMYADISVSNTGNATSYDIQVNFDPPLPIEEHRSGKLPLHRISVLRPGQSISSYLAAFKPLLEQKVYSVVVSWKRDPAKNDREENSYDLDLSNLEGLSHLGASDPLVQIAEEVKHIREDWRHVASGSHRIAANIFTYGEQLHERRQRDRYYRRIQHEKEKTKPPEASA